MVRITKMATIKNVKVPSRIKLMAIFKSVMSAESSLQTLSMRERDTRKCKIPYFTENKLELFSIEFGRQAELVRLFD